MSIDTVVEITNRALYLIIRCAIPVLLVSLVVGLVVSIFQTVTSIREQTLTFVPKILAVFAAIMILGSWIANTIIEYMTELWLNFNTYMGG